MAAIGRDRRLDIGFSATNLTTISGPQSGLDVASPERTRPTREVPGGGDSISRQSLEYEDWTLAFSIDCNDTSLPLLLGSEGQELHFALWPRDNLTGQPKWVGVGILSVTLSGNANEVMRFACTLEADGKITESVA